MTSPVWRYILHADLDAFYASVEQLDNPILKGSPLVVGGSPDQRGVVAAASYEARKYGVHSAMPMRTAFKLCPELVRISPRFARYREISRQVMDIFRGLTSLVEPLSLDEAYIDVSEQVPAEKYVDEVASNLKIRVQEETGLVVTIGGGSSKTVAKIASQVAKPDGLLLVKTGTEQVFMGPLDVSIISGVGPKTAAVLRESGIATIGHLATCEEGWLRQNFGKRGPELKERALGQDRGQVTPHRETKSVSAEVTMIQDVEDTDVLVERIEQLAFRVASQLQQKGIEGKTVYIKLRLANFTTLTRQMTLLAPTANSDDITRVACDLLRHEQRPGRKFRLVGVGATNFQETSQLALFPLS